MKTNVLILAAALLLMLPSCNQGELDKSNQQKDSLIAVLQQREASLSEREASLNEFISSFNEVERNLDSVAARQKILNLNADKGELKGNQKDRINAQIEAINDLMEKNRKMIGGLNRKVKNLTGENAKLKEAIETLNAQLAQKDSELAALNEKLNALNAQVAKLQISVDSLVTIDKTKSQTIADNTAAMHTAYYIIGKSKDLEAANVIDRTGGVIGLGKTSKISEEVDKSKFTKIDYTQTTSIPVNCTKVKIITSHPADSYKLEKDANGDVKSLVVINQEKFWGISKFLVIEGSPKK